MARLARRQISRRSVSHPVHVKFINNHDARIRIYHRNAEEQHFLEEWLEPREEMYKITCPGWRFEFVGSAGNFLYVTFHHDNSATPRMNHFTPTEAQSRETDASNPLLIFVHLSRLAVEADLSSVDPSGRPLHSLEATAQCYVSFFNSSPHPVAMYWFNYRGIRVHYGDIAPQSASFMDTYATHPWEFVDRTNHLKMLVNDAVVAEGGRRRYGDSEPYHFPRDRGAERHVVDIHSPLHSLKTLAMAAVRNEVARNRLRLDAEYVPTSLIRQVMRPAPRPGYLSLDEMSYFG